MNWNAVPVVVLAGITGYAAILFSGLYFSLAGVTEERSRREYLTFALTCVTVVAYDITCAFQYDARSLEQSFVWLRLSMFEASLVCVSYSTFVWSFLKRPIPWVFRGAMGLAVVLGLTVSLWESEYTLTVAQPHTRRLEVFGHPITYYETDYGILTQLLLLLFMLTITSLVGVIVSYFRSAAGRAARGRAAFLVATVISFITATSDILATAGLVEFMYTFEYGVAVLYVAMGYVLLVRFSALNRAVNALNRDLTATNVDLATALGQAKESIRVKTEFLASVSHELRTPLNAIINLPEELIEQFAPLQLARCTACGSEFELEEGDHLDGGLTCTDCGAPALEAHTRVAFRGDADTARACLHTVVQAARHQLRLVNDLLDASKLELGRGMILPTRFDPVELVEEIVDSTRATAEKSGVSVTLQPPDEALAGAVITADRVRIGQVLYNLLGNAIKFSPANGTVEVSLKAPSDDEWELSVRDHGIGIAEEHHGMIFEKFRQVDSGATRAYGGTGLGLAISKGLVELHGGRIWVESSKGSGATFVVRLPRTPTQLSLHGERVKPAA